MVNGLLDVPLQQQCLRQAEQRRHRVWPEFDGPAKTGYRFVKLPLPDNKEEERAIVTGLSDAINIEVLAGLEEGVEILEKPVKGIQ